MMKNCEEKATPIDGAYTEPLWALQEGHSFNMRIRLKRAILFSLIGLSHIFLSYNFLIDWWSSSVGSILILFFSYLIWGKDFLKRTGLQINLQTVIKSITLAVGIAICTLFIMNYIANKHNVYITFTNNWRDYYNSIFYILNEEIVIGSIILFALVNKRKIRPIIASIGLALFFALMHFVFYKWIFDDGVLAISTLTTLFLVAFLRNSLILQTGHIGYSWALHFGWIIVMFGSMYSNLNSNSIMTESEGFNFYLGSVEMLIISILIVGLYLAYWTNKVQPRK